MVKVVQDQRTKIGLNQARPPSTPATEGTGLMEVPRVGGEAQCHDPNGTTGKTTPPCTAQELWPYEGESKRGITLSVGEYDWMRKSRADHGEFK